MITGIPKKVRLTIAGFLLTGFLAQAQISEVAWDQYTVEVQGGKFENGKIKWQT